MALSFLYGSTFWIATSIASAQLAFPGAVERAAENLAARATASAEVTPAQVASADNGSAAAVASPSRSTSSLACPFCDGGDCIVCNQSGYRLDYDACGPYYGGPFFDEPCYAPPFSSAASVPAPKATEPDDLADEVPVAVAEFDGAGENGVGENHDVPERAGLLSTLSNAVDRAPGVAAVRGSVSAGVLEASRALELARQWLAGRPRVATVELPPARTEASDKLRDWFASSNSPEIAGNVESLAEPAVTKNVAPSVAQIDSLVPAEAFAPDAATANAAGKPSFVDWEAKLAEAYLDRSRAEASSAATVDSGLAKSGRVESGPNVDPNVVAPAIRTAAVALERLGHAALNLSGRLRNMAAGSILQ
ncbi:MAG: hypothetical protein WD875_13105 [Pirellulales bacterium]